MPPARICLIGAGNFARYVHGPMLKELAGRDAAVERAAVCDLNAERAENFARDFGFQRSYTDPEIMLQAGQIGHSLIFVGKGMLRQFYYKNGKDVTEHFSYEGSVVICIESIFKQEPTKLMIEALEPSIVYLLPYEQLMDLTKKSWEVNMLYRNMLEYSLILSQIKADSWRFETAKERYLRLMDKQPEIIKRAPLSCIASYLLMTPETLSRVRADIV